MPISVKESHELINCLFVLSTCNLTRYLMYLFQLEGSVDEGSTKSDEEYDDLAMQENGYMSDDDEELNNKMKSNDISKEETRETQKMDVFERAKSEPLPDTVLRALPPFRERKSGSVRLRKRGQSINR